MNANDNAKPELEAGDKVRTIFGNIETVLSADELMVVTYESQQRLTWYHPTKVWKTA